MGIIDNIVKNEENQIEYQAQNKIQSAVSGGINKIGASSTKAPVCPSCKAQLPTPMPKFCPKCGAKLSVTCPKCKTDYPLGTKFCPEDGTKLA
jgi:predicted amidophosphoribosyltransferase